MNTTANTPKITVKRDGTVEVNGKTLGSVGRGMGGSYKAGRWEASRVTLMGAQKSIGSFVTRKEAVDAIIEDYRGRYPGTAKIVLGDTK